MCCHITQNQDLNWIYPIPKLGLITLVLHCLSCMSGGWLSSPQSTHVRDGGPHTGHQAVALWREKDFLWSPWFTSQGFDGREGAALALQRGYVLLTNGADHTQFAITVWWRVAWRCS